MNRTFALIWALTIPQITLAQEARSCRVVLPAANVPNAVDVYLVFPEGVRSPPMRGTIVSKVDQVPSAVFEVPDQWSASTASLTIRDRSGAWHISPAPENLLRVDEASCAAKPALQKLVREARVRLSEAAARRDDAKAALDRLKADVDVIGNINRIVGTEQLLEERQWELIRATQVEKALMYKAKQLSRQPLPRFLQQRTSNLQRYAAAAAKASGPGAAESAELQAASRAMAEKLTLIESTKGEHMALLTRELARLKRERELLEDSLGFSVE
jgi:hypothetical protein